MRRAAAILLAVAVVGCSPDPGPTPNPSPTTTPAPTTATRDDDGPVQDLWVLHRLQAVLADGSTVDLLAPLTATAMADLAAPVAISSTATFSVARALDGHLRTMDGQARPGVDVLGGVIRDGDVVMVAFVATPRPGERWPDIRDLVSFSIPQVPGLDGTVPLVADYQFVQALPRSLDALAASGSPVPEDPIELLAARLLSGSFQYPAADDTDDADDLVFVGQVGRIYAGPAVVPTSTTPGAIRLAAFGPTAQGGGSSGGFPAKSKPFFDGQKGGAKKCLRRLVKPGDSALKCVKDVLDGQRKGAGRTNDLLNRNLSPRPDFRPDPGPTPRPRPKPKPSPDICSSGCGGGRKDPHMLTFDGTPYSLQLVGEFVAARAPGVEIQVRTAPVRDRRTVSWIVAVAVGVAGHVVEVPADRFTPILVDGRPVDVEDPLDPALALGDLEIEWQPWGVDLFLAEEPLLRVERHADHVDLYVVGGEKDGRWRGLLGDGDGRRANDLAARDGTIVRASDPNLYRAFADTWRLTDAESLFTYRAGESTATFTDPAFPDRTVTAATLAPAEKAQGETLCRLAGIDRQPLLDECVLDFTLTGDIAVVHGAQVALAAQRSAQVPASATFRGFLVDDARLVVEGTELAEIRGGELATGSGLALLRTTTDRDTVLHAVDLDTGEVRWTAADVDARCRPVVVEGVGVAAQLRRGSASAGNAVPVVLLALDDGRELARSAGDVPGVGCELALSVAGSLVIQPGRTTLRAFDAADGMAPRWTFEPGENLHQWAPEVDGRIVVLARELPATLRVRVLDPATGEEVAAQQVPGGAARALDVLGGGRIVVIADRAADEPRSTTLLTLVDGRPVPAWTRLFDDERELRQPVQLIGIGDVVAGWSIHADGRGLVGLDPASGETAWLHQASSFDNARGLVEVVGGLVAIAPFGGEWIELVDAIGETAHRLVPPDPRMRPSPTQLTALPDGRLIVTGTIDGPGGGVYLAIVRP